MMGALLTSYGDVGTSFSDMKIGASNPAYYTDLTVFYSNTSAYNIPL
jgi:hypothetical protein